MNAPVDVVHARCVRHQWTAAQLAGYLKILDTQARKAPIIGGGGSLLVGQPRCGTLRPETDSDVTRIIGGDACVPDGVTWVDPTSQLWIP